MGKYSTKGRNIGPLARRIELAYEDEIKARREFRPTKEDITLLILAGETYEHADDFVHRYGWDSKKWPHRGALVKGPRHWNIWDKRHGWIRV